MKMTMAENLVKFMGKWSGKSGGLILVNELKKVGVKDIENMPVDQRVKLVNALSTDYLSTFLGHSRFLVARSELVSILQIPEGSFGDMKRGFKRPRSPNLMGKPPSS